MNALRTGNKICDDLLDEKISCSMIPPAWYTTITKESTGKANRTAILLLSHIVYWYSPTERKNRKGEVVGIKKRFRSDLLQLSYKQISNLMHITKREAYNAMVVLEKLGILSRVFRTVNYYGTILNNVLYIDLHVKRLAELSVMPRYQNAFEITDISNQFSPCDFDALFDSNQLPLQIKSKKKPLEENSDE